MSQFTGLAALLTATFLSACVSASSAHPPQGAGGDEAAIRGVLQQVEDGWNASDANAAAAAYAADADFVNIGGRLLQGREAIEKGYAFILSKPYKDSRNTATIRSIRFLRPFVAVVVTEWKLESQATKEMGTDRSMTTMVMTKDGGKWSIVMFQNTLIKE